jgi:hypothetical protein
VARAGSTPASLPSRPGNSSWFRPCVPS